MKLIILGLIIYVLSALKVRDFIGKEYSKDGRFYGIDPCYNDLILVFLPVINTIGAILMIFDSPYNYMSKKHKKNVNKFFGIK